MQYNIYVRDDTCHVVSCAKKPINSNVCVRVRVLLCVAELGNSIPCTAMQCACGSVYAVHTKWVNSPLFVVIESVYSFIKQILSAHCYYVRFFFHIDAIICCYYQHKLNTYWIDCFALLNWIYNSILFGQIVIYKYIWGLVYFVRFPIAFSCAFLFIHRDKRMRKLNNRFSVKYLRWREKKIFRTSKCVSTAQLFIENLNKYTAHAHTYIQIWNTKLNLEIFYLSAKKRILWYHWKRNKNDVAKWHDGFFCLSISVSRL